MVAFLARHVRMTETTAAERQAAFADAVAALAGVRLQHGRYTLEVSLVDGAGGRGLTVRARRR